MRRLIRLTVLGLVVTSIVMGGAALAAKPQSSALAGPFAQGPGNSGPVKPGKGCGDKNHYHERESECKKAPK